jgi:hypothetical protein
MATPGNFPNRSDLRNPATKTANFTGQTYGQATQQARSQQAVRPGTQPQTVQAQRMAAGPVRPRPGGQPLMRPSERSSEPITAGAPFGAGPGPTQAGIRPRMIRTSRLEDQLLALLQLNPDREGLQMLLEKVRRTRGRS